jgi:hypothetical protein
MKDAITIVLALIILFLIWNDRQTASYDAEVATAERVPPDVTQVIIEKIQSSDPNIVPLETLFINHQGDGVYNSRFMFLNTKHFYGTQYDVQAKVDNDGSVTIMDRKDTAVSDYARAYKPDQYQSWEAIQGNLDNQLKDALSKPLTAPSLESYKPELR